MFSIRCGRYEKAASQGQGRRGATDRVALWIRARVAARRRGTTRNRTREEGRSGRGGSVSGGRTVLTSVADGMSSLNWVLGNLSQEGWMDVGVLERWE